MSLPVPAGWITTNDLVHTNTRHKQTINFLLTADYEHLQNVALMARGTEFLKAGGMAVMHLDSFKIGQDNLVHKIVFSDGVIWIARIPLFSNLDADQAEHARKLMLSEIATLRTLRRETTIPVPEVFAFEASAANTFGYPYMMMEFLAGQQLTFTLGLSVPEEYRAHVAKQVAGVFLQLQNLSFDQLGRMWCGESCSEPLEIVPYDDMGITSVPPSTSIEWFYKSRQDQNRRSMAAHAQDRHWRTACWILKLAIPYMIIENRVNGPFPLCNFNLHHRNLLFDDQYNLKGVLGWLDAGTAPFERLAVSRDFTTLPYMIEEEKQATINFREAVRSNLANLEAEKWPNSGSQVMLSEVLGSDAADFMCQCTCSSPDQTLSDAHLVARFLYGDMVSWEQLVIIHGNWDMY